MIKYREIEQITITIVDQDGKPVDFGTNNGERPPQLWSVLLTIEPDELKLTSHV